MQSTSTPWSVRRLDRARTTARVGLVFLCLVAWLAVPAAASWTVASEDGETSIKLGYLAVMRAESTDSGDDTSTNFFFRRFRIMFGGQLSERWSFFFETDSPNLGLSNSAGVKNAGDVFIQDFFVTYTKSPAFKVDAGLILIPLSHNSLQSAVTHLASDYGPYSFLNSAPTQSRVGRDYGLQLRGLVGEHFEYRAGVFNGDRGVGADEDLRFAGRVAYHVFEPDAGMFYTGNALGAKKILTFGLALDSQDDYEAVAADVYYDQPVGANDAFTVQADLIQYDGGDFFALPEQDTLLLELGYYFGDSKIQPWLQYAERDYDAASLADEERLYVGVNYRPAKYNRVLRAAYGRFEREGFDDVDQFQLTLQIFNF